MKKNTLIAMLLIATLFNINAQDNLTVSQRLNLTIYGNMSLEDAETIKESHPNEIEILATSNDEAAVHISEEATHILHELRGTHGPGYLKASNAVEAIKQIRHTRTERKQQMNFTITEGESVSNALAVLSQSNIENQIIELQNYGTRYHTMPAAQMAAVDLKAKWEAIATTYNRDDISVRLVDHSNATDSTPMNSVIMTITGAELPDEFVIIGGHLDSTSGQLSNAPGGDDDASGISVITEATRALLEIGFVPKRTIEVMAYAAEEVGLWGSKDIANQYGSNNVNVVAVGQFDMSNFKSSPKDVYFINDSNAIDPTLTDFFKSLLDTYHGPSSNDAITYGTTACGYGCSDHRFWFENGYKTAFPFESSFQDFQNNNWIYHSTSDRMENVPGADASHSFKFAKLAVEYLIEVSKKSSSLSTPDFSKEGYELYVIDNSLKYESQSFSSPIKSLKIFDITGKRIYKEKELGNAGRISLSRFSKGVYVVSIVLENKKQLSKKVVLK